MRRRRTRSAGLCKLIDFHIANGTAGIVVAGRRVNRRPNVRRTLSADQDGRRTCAGRISDRRNGLEFDRRGASSRPVRQESGRVVWSVGRSVLQQAVAGRTVSALQDHCRGQASSAVHNVQGEPWPIWGPTQSLPAQLPGVVGIRTRVGSDAPCRSDASSAQVKIVALLSGSDDTALAYMLLGGHGVIRSLPMWRRERGRYVRRGAEGKLDQARAANAMLMPLHTKLFVEANPIPVKWALAEMG